MDSPQSRIPDSSNLPPWLSVWFHPRQTVRHLIDARQNKLTIPLIVLAGLDATIDKAISESNGKIPWPYLGLGDVVGVVIGAVIGLYLVTALMHFTGKIRWINGSGSYSDLRIALAWAQLPAVVSLTLKLCTFNGGGLAQTILEGALVLWGLVLNIACIAEAQRVNWVKSLCNILLAAAIPASIGLAIIAMVTFMQHA